MLSQEIRSELSRDPFVPLRLYVSGGRKLEVPFKGVATVVHGGVLVMKGVKEGSRRATGYEVVGFDRIERIEQRAPKTRSNKGK